MPQTLAPSPSPLRNLRPYSLYALLLLILAAFLLYPILLSSRNAFLYNNHLSLTWFQKVLQDDTFRSQLFTSLALGLVVTLLCNFISLPLALIARRYDFKGKTLISALILAPLMLPPFVGAIGIRQILGNFGSLTILLQHLGLLSPHDGVHWLTLGGFWALAAIISLGLYPIAYLNLLAALSNIDPAMLEAAENLGGKRLRNFFKITLPLAMPGIFAGSALVFIMAFTELGSPLLLQYRNVVSRAIWDDLTSTLSTNSPAGYAKVVIVMAVSILVYFICKFTLGRNAYAMTSKAAVAAAPIKLNRRQSLLAASPFLAVIALAILPHIAVILYSFTAIAAEPAAGWGQPDHFGWYRTFIPDRYTLAGYQAVFQIPEIYGALLNSLKYAAVATFFDILLGISIAWLLIRAKIRGKTLLDILAMLPLAVPGIVMAFGFIAVTALVAQWFHTTTLDILKNYVFIILVIAYSIRRLPYLVRSAAGGLQQTSETLEEAAANLGAPPLRVLLKITLPLILANLIAGALLSFAFALLEVSDSLILAQLEQNYPITKMIYVLGTDMAGPANTRNACALGVIAMILLAATLLTAAMLLGKRLGTIFRA